MSRSSAVFGAPQTRSWRRAGGGHGFDEQELGLSGGLEVGEEVGEEGVEAAAGFAFEDDGAGEESVAVSVAAGVFLALGGIECERRQVP